MTLFAWGAARNTFAVFYKPITEDLEWSRGTLAGVVALAQLVLGVGYVLAGLAMDRLGPRKVVPVFALLQLAGYVVIAQATHLWEAYLGFGVAVALGSGIGAGPYIAICVRWFHQHRGLAIAVGGSAAQLGVIVFAPVNSLVIEAIGWRWTLAGLGLMTSGMFLLSSRLLHRSPEDVGLLPYGATEPGGAAEGDGMASLSAPPARVSLSDAARQPAFWLVTTVYAAANFSVGVVLFHLVNYATDQALSVVAAAGALSVMGAVGIGGRLILGALTERVPLRVLLSISITLIAIAVGLLPLVSEIGGIYLVSAAFGVGLGGLVVLQSLIPRALFGEYSLGAMVGVMLLATNVGVGVGALLGGLIFDWTGSYTVAFLIAAGLAGLAGLGALRTRV